MLNQPPQLQVYVHVHVCACVYGGHTGVEEIAIKEIIKTGLVHMDYKKHLIYDIIPVAIRDKKKKPEEFKW